MLSLAVLGLLSLVAACSGSDKGAEADPTATPTQVPASAPQALIELPEELFLTVSSPDNETVVFAESITVSGATTPSAVVSVNGEIIEVDALGEFAASVVLLEGPNLVEVVASDLSTQVRADLAVIYVLQQG